MSEKTAQQRLSPTQFKVAVALATGFTCREIAQQLGISVKTVDTHRGAVLRRLDLRNNVTLARLALREKWVGPERAIEPVGGVADA